MAEAYVIVSHDIGDGESVLVLTRPGRDDFLAEMCSSGGDRSRYRLIVRTVARIQRRGAPFRGTMVRSLDSGLSLVEVKVPGRVIRVMAYEGARLVLLFSFDGHQGSDKISRSDMEKARRLAAEARKAASQFEEGIVPWPS